MSLIKIWILGWAFKLNIELSIHKSRSVTISIPFVFLARIKAYQILVTYTYFFNWEIASKIKVVARQFKSCSPNIEITIIYKIIQTARCTYGLQILNILWLIHTFILWPPPPRVCVIGKNVYNLTFLILRLASKKLLLVSCKHQLASFATYNTIIVTVS